MAAKQLKAARVQMAAQGAKSDPDAVYIKLELNKGEVAESQAEAYYRAGLEHYRAAGKRLAKVRGECEQRGHPYYRKYGRWLKEHGIDHRRASECITIHEGWDKLPPGGTFGKKAALRIIKGDEITKSTNGAGTATGATKSEPKTEAKKPKDKGGVDREVILVPGFGHMSLADSKELKAALPFFKKAWALPCNEAIAAHAVLKCYREEMQNRKGGEPCQR